MSARIKVSVTIEYDVKPEAFHIVNFFEPGSVGNEQQAIAHTEEVIRERLEDIFTPGENPSTTVESMKTGGDR